MPATVQAEVLLDGLVIGESARWHDGRLWFAHWGTGEIVAVGLDGRSEVVGRGPDGLGWSIDWLHDGRLLVTGPGLTRREPDGSLVRHADLTSVADHGWNEIVVDGRGNIYLNGAGGGFGEDGGFRPGIIALVTPDGRARQVADDIAFPNGMVVTPDNRTLVIAESVAARLTAFDIDPDGGLSGRRVWAEDAWPDGICIDAEGAIWTGTRDGGALVRMREGGEVTHRVELDRAPFSSMLGGPDGRTLFALAQTWRMGGDPMDNIRRLTTGPRTGQVVTAPAPAPRAGWP